MCVCVCVCVCVRVWFLVKIDKKSRMKYFFKCQLLQIW